MLQAFTWMLGIIGFGLAFTGLYLMGWAFLRPLRVKEGSPRLLRGLGFLLSPVVVPILVLQGMRPSPRPKRS